MRTQPKLATDVEMLRNNHEWPRWPFLPVKRPNLIEGFPDCSTVVLRGDGQLVLLEKVGIFDQEGLAKGLEAISTLRTWTPEELVAEGWMVD